MNKSDLFQLNRYPFSKESLIHIVAQERVGDNWPLVYILSDEKSKKLTSVKR